MNECKDLISLNKITSEVDESHIKIILSSQCIKAQIYLVERLRKESERQKEVCKHLSSSNIKLDAEIKHAGLELKSLMTAVATMQSSNIEFKKELLLMKERKQETAKRCQSGNLKYEQLWLQCKKRYESIPYVQKWFEFTNKTQTLTERIKFLDQEAITLKQEIKSKRGLLLDLENKQIIELCKYLSEERPKLIQDIKQKHSLVYELNKEINILVKDKITPNTCKARSNENCVSDIFSMDTDWPNLVDCLNNDKDSIEMPTLQLRNYDLNIFTVNLEQKKKCSSALTSHSEQPIKVAENVSCAGNLDDQRHVTLFAKSYISNNDLNEGSDATKFSKKRLINIIEDINIDKKEAVEIISTFNQNDMQIVDTIGVDFPEDGQDTGNKCNETVSEEIIIASKQPQEELVTEVMPPTQFLDEATSPQGSQRKKVSFELPVIQEIEDEAIDTSGKMSETIDGEANITVNSQLETSIISNESFNKMKETILKRHRLDLSPDFVYAKKKQENQTWNNDNSEETSKFFKRGNNDDGVKIVDSAKALNHNNDNDDFSEVTEEVNDQQTQNEPLDMTEVKPVEDTKTAEKSSVGPKSVAGFLFTHGPLGIPDSLDLSISTTGYEEGDIDYPQYIDSSLLLSPKADNAMASGSEGVQVFSQEVPNFLSGLRKGGFSFFGSTSNNDSSSQGDAEGKGNNFNFNFGGDNKKSKGGLFRMFQ